MNELSMDEKIGVVLELLSDYEDDNFSSNDGIDLVKKGRDLIEDFEIEVEQLQQTINEQKEDIEGFRVWLQREMETCELGDGYDYPSGFEYGLRKSLVKLDELLEALEVKALNKGDA